MDFEHARSVVLNFLRSAGRAKNSDLIGLLGGDREMFERVREDLIFYDLATDKDSVGLILRNEAAAASIRPQTSASKARAFISYGRRDAGPLVDRLCADLSKLGFSVWRDTREIKAGAGWQQQITDNLREANVVIAVMSPHSVRTTLTVDSPDNIDSICLAEISYALYVPPPRALVPVMAQTCEPPLAIFHLDYVDMREWSQSEAQYQQGLAKLIDSIEVALRGEKRYRSWHNTLDPFNFSAFLHERRRDFTGRQWFFNRLDDWRRKSTGERALLVIGDPGSGKSALVSELVYRNPDGQVLAYHCCQWDRPDTLRAWRMVRSLAAMVASKFESYAAMLRSPGVQRALEESNCRNDPAGALEDGLLTPLQGLTPPEGGPRYILIDALDESLEVPHGEQSIVEVLATRLGRLPDWLRLVATTRKDPTVLDRLQGLRADRLETHSPENAADLADFVRMRLSGVGLTLHLKDLNITASTVAEHILRQSDGNFLYAQQALDGIERGLIDTTLLDRLPPGLSGLYQNRLLHQFPDTESFAKPGTLLEIAIASQEPLTEALLAVASGFDHRELAGVLREVSAYLPTRLAQDGTERYAIYHKSLTDWLTDPKRRGSVHVADVHAGHERLAISLWREFSAGVENMSAYGLAHLPAHLVESQRWDDIANLLTDIVYLEARNRAGQVFELAKDFSRAWQALPANHPTRSTLQLIDEALRRDIQFIHAHREDYPQALFQCLWNYCWWYDSRSAGIPTAPSGSNGAAQAGGYLARLFGISQRPNVPSPAPAQRARPASEPGALSARMELMRADARRGTAARLWLRALTPPPESLGSPQRLVLRGHKDAVIGAWFLTDEQLMSASKDGMICLWDTVTGMQRSVFSFGSPVRGLEFVTIDVAFSSPEGRLARAAWVKKEFRRQNLETKAWETFELRDPTVAGNYITFAKCDGSDMTEAHGGTARMMDLAYGAGGAMLAIAQADGVVLLLDTRSGELRGRFDTTKPPEALTRIVGAPRSRQTKQAGDDPVLAARSTLFIEQDEMEVMFEHRQNLAACSVAVSPDGNRVACGTWTEAVHIWQVAGGAETHRLHGHVNRTKALAFSPDGGQLASGSDDRDIRIWDLTQACAMATLAHDDRVKALVYSADGKRILSGANDMLVRLWDVQSGQELKVLSGHAAAVTTVALSPDGRLAASGSADNTIRLWDLQSSLASRRSPGHSAQVTALAFAPNGDWFVSGSADFSLRIWDARSGEERRVLSGHGGHVSSVAVTPDCRSIVSASSDATIRIWDAQSGRQDAVLEAGSSNMHNVRSIAGGRKIICVEGGTRLYVWDAKSRTKLFEVPNFGVHRTSYAIAPGDTTAAVATNEAAEMQVWDPQQQWEVTYHLRDPSIAGPLVTLWDLSTGKELLRLRAHKDSVDSVAFHPEGKRLVTASSDQAIIWEVGRGMPVGRLEGITSSLDQLAYSVDGARIIGGHGKSDTVWIWSSDGGPPLTSFSGYRRFHAAVAWEADPASAQAYVENEETVVIPRKESTDVVRFPVPLTLLTSHPQDPVWVGAAGRHIHLLACDAIVASGR